MEAFWCEMYSPSGCSIAIESENLTIICLYVFLVYMREVADSVSRALLAEKLSAKRASTDAD